MNFQINVLEQLDIICKNKNNLLRNLIHFTEMNSKWIISLNVKFKPIKLTKDNIGENLSDLRFGGNFLFLFTF